MTTCQRDCECVEPLACLDGHCLPRPGSVPHYSSCHASADCSTADGPAVCEVGRPCVCISDPSGFSCTDYARCVGSYDADSGTGALCHGCRCARGLVCENGRCAPAPTS